MLLKILVTTIAIFVSFSANAIEIKADYKCIVKNASQLTDKGKSEEVESWRFYVGKEFVVERNSGVISGEQFKNNIASIEPTVFDHFVNGYSVVASANEQVVSYLQVNNFEKSKQKPFILIKTNVVLTGTCLSY